MRDRTGWKTGKHTDNALLVTSIIGIAVLSILYLASRSSSASGAAQRPPHVSSWVPWLGSGIHLATNPDKFFNDAIRKHGPVFSLTAVGKKMIYVTSPGLIAQVYGNPKTLQSKEADHNMGEELFPAHSRQLQPGTIGPMVSSFVEHLSVNIRSLAGEVDATGGVTITESGKIHHVMSVSTLAAMMGTTFPASEFLPAFTKFDSEFTKLAGELPTWMCKDAIKYREACLDILEDRYVTYNRRFETETLAPDEQVSAVIRAVLDFSGKHGTATRDIAAFLLADMFATQANAPPAAAWCVVKLSENPRALARLRGEIADGVEGSLREKEVVNGSTFEFLGSAIKETLRLVTSVASIRRVMEDTILTAQKGTSDGVLLRKGEMIYCLTRPTHTDSTVHRDAEEWIPERFMPDYWAKGEGKTVKND
ncbi:hypothetical protein QFC20_005104 [Naganishia adeliensis]|uniref:Uncharacterized protein n=1 Tax=Naganishia adeliensis TaxID=92952 RepID=A0ACC2VSN7_9TREE|nr:hypothetical protein QFC20_005104 [Naganishia adeliensis]